jgi:hypothetical protein
LPDGSVCVRMGACEHKQKNHEDRLVRGLDGWEQHVDLRGKRISRQPHGRPTWVIALIMNYESGSHETELWQIRAPYRRTAWLLDGEYDIPLPGSCQSADKFTPTVIAIDKLANVIKALTPPGEGTIASWSTWEERIGLREHAAGQPGSFDGSGAADPVNANSGAVYHLLDGKFPGSARPSCVKASAKTACADPGDRAFPTDRTE